MLLDILLIWQVEIKNQNFQYSIMLKKIFNEPLVHFALLGIFLFFLFKWVSDDDTDRRIVVDQYDLNEIIAKWNLQWSRDPTEEELKGLLDNYIKQEIYYREALAMRLDHNDEVVKRRMAQKIQFLTQDVSSQVEPTQEQLKNFLEDNAERYIKEKEVSFKHKYFSPDKRSNADSDALLALGQDNPIGDHPPMPSEYNQATMSKIRADFGQAFSDEISKLNVSNSWQGPIKSGYGVHIIKIDQVTESRPYEYEEIKIELQNDYQYEFQLTMNEELLNSLLEKYQIILEFEEQGNE